VRDKIAGIDDQLEQFPVLNNLEKQTGASRVRACQPLSAHGTRTGIPRLYLALMVVILFGNFFFLGYGVRILTGLVGFLYPTYASFKTLTHGDKHEVGMGALREGRVVDPSAPDAKHDAILGRVHALLLF
jgi:hypothetical protein